MMTGSVHGFGFRSILEELAPIIKAGLQKGLFAEDNESSLKMDWLIASESSLKKDWLTAEEDKAWEDL